MNITPHIKNYATKFKLSDRLRILFGKDIFFRLNTNTSTYKWGVGSSFDKFKEEI